MPAIACKERQETNFPPQGGFFVPKIDLAIEMVEYKEDGY